MQFSDLAVYFEAQHGLVTSAQLGQVCSREVVRKWERHGVIERVHRGVYRSTAIAPSWKQLLCAAQLTNSSLWASHHTAATLLGIDFYEDDWVHVSSLRSRPTIVKGMRLHVTDRPSTIRTVDGLRVSSPARTLVDIACFTGGHDWLLERAVESALHQRMTSIAGIYRLINEIAASGRNGVGLLRELLEQYELDDDRTESSFELRVARALRSRGLPEPVKQYEVVVGGRRRRVDLAYPDLGIAIEVQSRAFHTRLRDFDRDAQRNSDISASGLTLLYVTWNQFEESIDRIVRVVTARMAA